MRHAERSVGFLYMEAWQEYGAVQLRQQFRPEKPLDGPVALDVEFYRQLPATAPTSRLSAIKRYQDSHITKRPDLDNYRKAFSDFCQGILFWVDSQVVEGYTKKRFAEAGEPGYTLVRLRTVEL